MQDRWICEGGGRILGFRSDVVGIGEGLQLLHAAYADWVPNSSSHVRLRRLDYTLYTFFVIVIAL